MISSNDHKPVELIFPRPKRDMDVYLPKVKGEEFFQVFSTEVNTVAEWFSEYDIDSLELRIDSIIDSPKGTKLILGSNRENGLTVVLKSKPKTSADSNVSFSKVDQESKVEA